MSVKSIITLITFGFYLAYGQNSPYVFLNRTQRTFLDKNRGMNKTIVARKPGEIVSVQTLKDGTTTVTKIDLTEMVDLIVEMKDRPLFIQQRENSGFVLQKSMYINRLAQFRSDIETLHRSAVNSLKTTLASPVIRREYYKIFVGAAVRVPRAMISQIASLSYVKRVHADEKVNALLEQSVHQIHADSVWTMLGDQGDSIVVGIIDTGIDYLDSALGGGFGPAFKVIGGYDFVNNDSDPMDDHGHGTHVAGIVAANGDGLKGVAPHAKLMAFKVLDKNGGGSESSVLAGIERATDPNDDGNSNDMVDVVNMSLGGHGSPDDALSTAVDNAVKLGITFCIAAGNSGSYYAIGSPGTARLAITVGAVDLTDNIAVFSSRGPNPVIYSIKPEVVAPGVDILSTLPNNTTGSMSGTSMAAPHVAGVCALLKSLHRNWTPSQIKSAIMTTALNLGQEVMTQGAGRIDALKAAEVSAFVIPSHLSFGLDGFTSTWSNTDTVWISNHSDQSQSFNMAFENLKSGISMFATPSSISLAQNDSQQVLVTITIDNSQVPYPLHGSLAYSGNAYIYGTKDTLYIPWAFVKAAKVDIAFDQPYADFFIANSSFIMTSFDATWIDKNHTEFIVPPGIYDLLVDFWGSSENLIFREGLNIDNMRNLSVSSTEAKYCVNLSGVDQKGQPLSSSKYRQNVFLFAFPDSSRMGSLAISTYADSIFTSGFSNHFKLICGETSFQSPNIYNINFNAVHGLQANKSFSNQPREFHIQYLLSEFPPQSQYQGINAICWTSYGFGYFGSLLGSDMTDFIGMWNGKLFFNSGKDSLYSFPISLVAFDQPLPDSSTAYWGPWFESAPFTVANDSIGMFFGPRSPASLYLSPNDGRITLGGGLNYTNVSQYNNSYGSSSIAAFPYFYGALDEEKYTTIYRSHYTIYNNNDVVIAKDTLINMEPINVPAGEYRLEVKNQDYYVRGVRGLATLTTRFDLRKTDSNPPRITSLRLLNQSGQARDALSVGEHGTLVFSLIDDYDYYQNTGSAKLFYRKSGTPAWNSLPVTLWMVDTAANLWNPRGLVYKADMTAATQFDSTGIDIKLVLQDRSGNTTEWSLEPAFGVGTFGALKVVEEENSFYIPGKFVLRQNYPNPFNLRTTIEFDVPYRSIVTLEIFNMLGQKVSTVLAKDLQAGMYIIPWNANNVSSGVYFYRLSAVPTARRDLVPTIGRDGYAGSFTDTKKFLLLK